MLWPFLLLETAPALIMYWGLKASLRTRRAMAASRRTRGSVLSLDTWKGSKGQARTYAVLEFTTPAGEKIETRSEHVMRGRREPGSAVNVCYLPEEPTRAWIEGEAEAVAVRTLLSALVLPIGWTVVMAWYTFIELPG
ncbi:DUF3592 domain-containing protein [Planomonospora venezuelensis]|uniref:DUF3592 domain-containing protein n=1 Tax=Planomonospora venezuelensis TaxID=1999 RepID=A0A841D8K3_PLAVE|nr:DUF3592 domain-containing protein [Planomonospora venezuelensis]MBB5963736.1 hypothetical protein [Planomonospora venezuelensis]